VRLCLAQISPRLGDVWANLDGIEAHLASAASEGAELAVFPELALTGYRLRDLVPHVSIRLDQPGEALDRLAALSRRLPYVVGLVEESAEHRFYNSAVHFEDGQIRHVHRKCYLPMYGMFDEAMDFAEGERIEAYDSAVGRVGLMVCEDAWHPATSTVLTQDGARLLIVLAATPVRGLGAGSELLSQDSWHQLIATLARFHTAAAVWVNRSGFEDGLAFAGASFGVTPAGAVIAEAPPLEESLLTLEIDDDEIRAARAAYPVVRDERPHLLSREFARVDRRKGSRNGP